MYTFLANSSFFVNSTKIHNDNFYGMEANKRKRRVQIDVHLDSVSLCLLPKLSRNASAE